MAGNDSTLSNTCETRAGAMACMDALRAINSIVGGFRSDHSMEAWWRGEDDAVAAMLQAAGNPTGFTAGFIAALADYVLASHGGTLNLDKWIPEAAMTAGDKAASRIKFEEEVAEGNKEIEITEDDRDMAYQEASMRAKKSIGELLTSADDFRNRCAGHVAAIAPVFVVATDGYSFENATMEKINHSITALREIIKGGEVAFAPSIHDQRHSEIIAGAFESHGHIWAGEVEMNAYIRRFMTESQPHKIDMEPASI